MLRFVFHLLSKPFVVKPDIAFCSAAETDAEKSGGLVTALYVVTLGNPSLAQRPQLVGNALFKTEGEYYIKRTYL